MKLVWTTFTGIRPKVDERLLPDGNAQVADNVNTDHGGLRAMPGAQDVMALAKNNVRTIYRFGQALTDPTQFWFHWDKDVDVVKGPIDNDTEERTYWTGDGAPKYTTAQIGTGGTNLPSASRPLGVAGPGMAPTLTATGEPPDGAGAETRVYIYTFVSDQGEESAPSAPATADMVVGQGMMVSSMETSASNGAVLAFKRIYRAQRGVYLQVAQVPVSQTTYIDNVPSAQLGAPCPSIGWDMPPNSLAALTGGPNGMMAGIDGYTVRFCDPYHPFAWPVDYSYTVGYPCVGLGQFGQTFVVLTTGLPYTLAGIQPGQMTMASAKFYQPCLSKRSIVCAAGDVIWASPDGLVSLGASGEHVLTENIFTPEQWRAMNPETITAEWHEGWYVASHLDDAGAGRSFMFRPSTQEFVPLPSLAITAMFRDTVGDALYVCINDRIQKFRAGDLMPFTWRSQEIVSHLTDFVVARVTGSYPVGFRLYKNELLKMTKTVTSDEPFKLPAGLARQWSVEVEGVNPVLGIAISSSEEDV